MESKRLKLIVKEGEGLTVEFKARFTPKMNRDIVAFANTKGGYVLLGVDDNGIGLGERLTNKMKSEINSIARNCDPAVEIKCIKQIGKMVAIEIPEGEEKPYSCADGYYRRLDAVTQKMTQKEIRLIYKKTDAVPFEEQANKDVGFRDISTEKIKTFFAESGISVRNARPQDVLSSLNLAKKNAIKNAGVLFFAAKPRDFILQCQMTLVAFKGKDRIQIYDRMDIQDDLLAQFNEAVTFLQKHLNVRSEIIGVNRQDRYEIPLEALREAVANAIIHRDYSMRGTSLMVEVHENRVVISNPGGLPEGLDPRSLTNISVRRNELIADIFARMDKVERMGTGIKRMRDAMKAWGLPYPKIESDLFFTITFHRPTYSLRKDRYDKIEVTERVTLKVTEKVTENQEVILGEMRNNPHITADELSKIVGISPRKIKENIKKLKVKDLIRRIGSAKGGHWEVLFKTVHNQEAR